MARFSVDIDVVFCDPAVGREEAVRQISRELIRIRAEIVSMGFEAESIYISACLSFLSWPAVVSYLKGQIEKA